MKPIQVTRPSPLLELLLKNLPEMKRTGVKQLLKFGSVRVNGNVTTQFDLLLREGDRIDFLDKRRAASERAKKRLSFQVIHEDAQLLVVEKPAGLLTISTESEKERTLYFEVTAYVRAANKDARVFIVHRLDRDTSGLLVVAKDLKTKVFLQENWDQAVKKYAAVVEGRPAKNEGTIRSALKEDKFRRVYASGGRGAKESITHYRVEKAGSRYSLLELLLGTGRKNQIRVHLADMGHPVAGDLKYGAASDPLGRLALHASFLSFPKPSGEGVFRFTSEAPQDFLALCR